MIFSHCGDSGDLIYAMHTIKILSNNENNILNLRRHYNVREPFTEQKVEDFRKFLESQSYVNKVDFNLPEIGIELDKWRSDGKLQRILINRYGNIASLHALAAKISNYPQKDTWLTCDEPKNIADIIISRTLRYNNDNVYWDKILNSINLKESNLNYLHNFYFPNRRSNPNKHFAGKRYNYDAELINREDVVFVGYKDEYDSFVNKFGFIKYYPTPTFYELFQVIAGCKMFCSNQSAPMALAIGLGVPQIIQEVWALSPNCRFNRNNIFYLE